MALWIPVLMKICICVSHARAAEVSGIGELHPFRLTQAQDPEMIAAL